MIQNRFHKTTPGIFAEVAVGGSFDTAQATYAAFVLSAAAGALSAFWSDDKTAVAAGGTTDAANANRKFFFAWKQADGTVEKTTDIPAGNKRVSSVAYSEGANQVSTITYGGTIEVGQTIYAKILETTGTHLPFPSFIYEATVTTDTAAAVAALAARINAEKENPVVTAAASGNVLTLTGVANNRSFKQMGFIETTAAKPNDLSAVTLATTTKAAPSIGDAASIKEFENFGFLNTGGALYTPTNYNAEELGVISSNIAADGQYGFVLISSRRDERGAVRNYDGLVHTIIIVPTDDVAAVAGL